MNAVIKNAFVNAVATVPVKTHTANGMKAQESSMSAVVDLFYNIGASRGKDLSPQFETAMQQNEDLALRVALWSRDVRGGAGERSVFRFLLSYLEKSRPEILLNTKFLEKVPELGRWDDLLIFTTPEVKNKAFTLIWNALQTGNALTAKWMPRKGPIAAELRSAFWMTPKAYRKFIVGLSNTVEQKLCSKKLDEVNYSHVPSLAMSRYMKVFSKNDTARFVAYRNSLIKGETKINAAGVYPYDIIKSLKSGSDAAVCDAQWNALPDYMDGTNVLPMVDVSGSMCAAVGGNPNLSCLDAALSLGLYTSDKNKGPFKDTFLTFSSYPTLNTVKGTLSQKMTQMNSSKWGMNTNLHAAFDRILTVAVEGNVPASDMPKILLILSDMQFDQCVNYDDSAMKMIERKFAEAGYDVPVIVFWNLNASYRNTPVSFDKKGTALVSGLSPAIMKAVLAANFDDFTPESIVRDAVSIERYSYL